MKTTCLWINPAVAQAVVEANYIERGAVLGARA